MSQRNDEDAVNESELERTFQFDKFVQDLERREQLRHDADVRAASDLGEANRLRDARNREHLHNRLRWTR